MDISFSSSFPGIAAGNSSIQGRLPAFSGNPPMPADAYVPSNPPLRFGSTLAVPGVLRGIKGGALKAALRRAGLFPAGDTAISAPVVKGPLANASQGAEVTTIADLPLVHRGPYATYSGSHSAANLAAAKSHPEERHFLLKGFVEPEPRASRRRHISLGPDFLQEKVSSLFPGLSLWKVRSGPFKGLQLQPG